MIKKEGEKYVLYSKDGSKKLGEFDSEDQAKEREDEIRKIKHARVNIVSAVNAAKISKAGNIITIRDVVPIVSGIVMNGGAYFRDEISPSFMSLNQTPAPAGHPQDKDGNYISAKNALALQGYWIGAGITNAREVGGQYLCDVTINIDQAMAMPAGRELLARCEAAMNGQNIDPIHVSTGVMLRREQNSGESKGKKYSWIARNMEFDHLAILLNQQGAGTPSDGVGMWLNQEGQQEPVMVCNMNEDDDMSKIEALLNRIETAVNSLFQSKETNDSKKEVQLLDSGQVANVDKQPLEVNQMDKEIILAALNAAGINSAGMSDKDVLSAYVAIQTKPLQSALTAANEKIAGFELAESQAKESAKRAIAEKLAVNSSLKVEDFMLMSNERLEELSKSAAPVVIGNAAKTDEKQTFQLPE